MEKPNMRREEFRSTRVCIDSYENGVLCGSLHNPYFEQGCSFESTTQFLLEMEKLLEQMEFPKAFQSPRTFAKTSDTTGPPAEIRCSGNLATFTIRVLFRQNASWQGSVVWHEGRQEESFRSVLELLLLMHSALSMEKAS